MGRVYNTTLDNNVKLIWQKTEHEMIGIDIKITCGSAHDTKAGLCHLVEHMLTKSVPGKGAEDIAKILERDGAKSEQCVQKDLTELTFACHAENLDEVLEVLSEAIKTRHYSRSDIVKERRTVLGEIQRRMDDPNAYAEDLLYAKLFPNSALGIPTCGIESRAAKAGVRDVAEFKRQYYTGMNVQISVAGNFNTKKMKRTVQKYFGEISRGKRKARTVYARVTNKRREYVKELDIRSGYHYFGYRVPGKKDEDHIVLRVLEKLLYNGNCKDPIFQTLREAGAAYNVGCEYNSYKKLGVFHFFADGIPDMNSFQKVRELYDSLFRRIKEDPVADEELERAKKTIIDTYSPDEVQSLALHNNDCFFYGKDTSPKALKKALDRITAEDVMKAARKYFTEEYTSVAVVPKRWAMNRN